MTERYAVFAGYEQPSGGWRDFVGFAGTLAKARGLADLKLDDDDYLEFEWGQIVDTETGRIVSERSQSCLAKKPMWRASDG